MKQFYLSYYLFAGAQTGCRNQQFSCKLTKKCIPLGWMCDGEADCGVSPTLGVDTSDEEAKQCKNINRKLMILSNHTNYLLNSESAFRIQFSELQYLLISGRQHFKCGPNEAECSELLQCVPVSKFCDGHGDCPDNSDEWDFCGKLFSLFPFIFFIFIYFL